MVITPQIGRAAKNLADVVIRIFVRRHSMSFLAHGGPRVELCVFKVGVAAQ